MNYAKYASRNAWVTALVFSMLLSITIFTGVSQQPFEGVRALEVHVQQLASNAFWLQTILALDNVFIVLYVSSAILIALALQRADNHLLLGFFVGGVALAGLLDFIENHHILTQLVSVNANLPIVPAELQMQMTFSMLKWHLGYFAFFVVAFAMQPRTRWERIVQITLWLQLPLGVLAYTLYDPALTRVFFLLCYFDFLAGFVAFALLMQARSTEFRASEASANAAQRYRANAEV